MSLILDALRKADAERERGSVPSLHSQPVASTSAGTARPATRPHWLWIAIGVAIGLAGAATWMMLGSGTPQTSATANLETAQSASVPPSAARVAPPGATVAPVTGAASSAPAVAPSNTQPVAQPAPWRQPDDRKDARAEGKGTPAPQGAGPAPADVSVVSRDQLPPNIRSELPQFAVGGSIYSNNPAARSLIVNGQLYREKDRLTQDLSLEEIKLKAAVFSFRGYRFEVLF
ncbi:MAG: general secretion pathway protein GspB [Burkholderiaceae bacterium]